MKNEPSVSVLIPVYNASKYIESCLQSIINQSFGDWEIIAVNDGSTDGSLDILKEYSNKDSRIKYIDQPNGGASEARRTAVKAATGKYVLFLDGDDWLAADALQKMYDRCEEQGLDFLECTFTMHCQGVEWATMHKYTGLVNNRMFLTACAECGESIAITCALSRRGLWTDDVFLPHGVILPNEDLYPLFAFWNRIKRAEIRNDWPIYYYRKNPTSATFTGVLLKRQDLWKEFFSRVRELLKSQGALEYVELHLRMQEIDNFGFFIEPINTSDEWYRQIIAYKTDGFKRKYKILHFLIRYPRLLYCFRKVHRQIKIWKGK